MTLEHKPGYMSSISTDKTRTATIITYTGTQGVNYGFKIDLNDDGTIYIDTTHHYRTEKGAKIAAKNVANRLGFYIKWRRDRDWETYYYNF